MGSLMVSGVSGLLQEAWLWEAECVWSFGGAEVRPLGLLQAREAVGLHLA